MGRCNPHVLFESSGLSISTCKSCGRIGLHYKNVLCGFNRNDFCQFAQRLLSMNFYKNAVCFPDGQSQVIIGTCHQDIQFCFGSTEFDQLKRALEESLLMLEVHTALEIKQNG